MAHVQNTHEVRAYHVRCGILHTALISFLPCRYISVCVSCVPANNLRSASPTPSESEAKSQTRKSEDEDDHKSSGGGQGGGAGDEDDEDDEEDEQDAKLKKSLSCELSYFLYSIVFHPLKWPPMCDICDHSSLPFTC